MYAASRHGTPTLKSLPKDDEMSCENILLDIAHPPVMTPPDLENTAGKIRNHTFPAGIRNIMTGK